MFSCLSFKWHGFPLRPRLYYLGFNTQKKYVCLFLSQCKNCRSVCLFFYRYVKITVYLFSYFSWFGQTLNLLIRRKLPKLHCSYTVWRHEILLTLIPRSLQLNNIYRAFICCKFFIVSDKSWRSTQTRISRIALYQNCEIHSPWTRGSEPMVGHYHQISNMHEGLKVQLQSQKSNKPSFVYKWWSYHTLSIFKCFSLSWTFFANVSGIRNKI